MSDGSGDEIENDDGPPKSPIISTYDFAPSTPDQEREPKIISTPPTLVKGAAIAETYADSPAILRGVAQGMEQSRQSKTGINTKTATESNRTAITAATNLFDYLYDMDLSREKVRTTLAIDSNEKQMANVWGSDIVRWANGSNCIDCPCCYLCGLPINYFNTTTQTPPQMEHKIPSINAYLNVPHFLRTKNTPFWDKWQTYITNARKGFEPLTRLYNLINCADNYNPDAVNVMFEEIFQSAGLQNNTEDSNYWRELLKFWMMEFAYAHAICNGAKSFYFICGDLRSGATAEDDVVSDKDVCVDNIISNPKYKAFVENASNRMSTYQEGMISGLKKGKNTTNFKNLLKHRENRTTNMFNNLIETLYNVQELYFQRMPGQTTFNRDIRQQAIIATNIRYAAVYSEIKLMKEERDNLLSSIENTTNQIDNIGEAIAALNSMKAQARSPRQKDQIDQKIRSNQTANLEYKKDVETLQAQSGEYSQKINRLWPGAGTLSAAGAGNVTQHPYTSADVNTSLSSANTSQSSSGYSADTASSRAKKRTKYNPTKGGTLKNKRRTQKRIASRRRKRNKRSITRRKRYTRKQKK
jgi:hypothetical protein